MVTHETVAPHGSCILTLHDIRRARLNRNKICTIGPSSLETRSRGRSTSHITMASTNATIRHATREGTSSFPSPTSNLTNSNPRRPHNPVPHPRARRLRKSPVLRKGHRRVPRPHTLPRRPLRPREPRQVLQGLRKDPPRHRPRRHRRRHGIVLLQLQHLDGCAGYLP